MNKKFDKEDLAVIAIAKTSLILSEEKFGEEKNKKVSFKSFSDSLVQLKDGIDWINTVLTVYNYADFAFDELKKYCVKDKAINLKLYNCFVEVLSVKQEKELFEHNKEAVQEKLLNQKVDIMSSINHIVKNLKRIKQENSSNEENGNKNREHAKTSIPLLENEALGTLGLAKSILIRGLQENKPEFINFFVEAIATIVLGYSEYPAKNVIKACRFFFEDDDKAKNDLLIKKVKETCKKFNEDRDYKEYDNEMADETIEFVTTCLEKEHMQVIKEFDDITQKYLGGLTDERWAN